MEDNEPALLAMGEFFSVRGFDVDCARGPEDARARLGASSYAAVIADLRLTGPTGREGLAILAAARARCRSTCTILLSAWRSPDVEAEARRRGVDVFLDKPHPLPELARIVDELVIGRRAERWLGDGDGR